MSTQYLDGTRVATKPFRRGGHFGASGETSRATCGDLPIFLQIPDLYPSDAVDAAVERLMTHSSPGATTAGESPRIAPSNGYSREAGGRGTTQSSFSSRAGSSRSSTSSSNTHGTEEDRPRQQVGGSPEVPDEPSAFERPVSSGMPWGQRLLVAGAIAVLSFTALVAWDRSRRLSTHYPVEKAAREAGNSDSRFLRLDRESFTSAVDEMASLESTSPRGAPSREASRPAEAPVDTEPAQATEKLFPMRHASPSSVENAAGFSPWPGTLSGSGRTDVGASGSDVAPASWTQENRRGTEHHRGTDERQQPSGQLQKTIEEPGHSSGERIGGAPRIEPYTPRLLLPRVEDHENSR